MERSQELSLRSAAELCVERTGIWFYDVAGDQVRVQVTVHNAGEQRSLPMPLRLESAPLGAFVPWRPLATLLVPALEAGESHELSTHVPRPRPAPLGDFNRLPPRRLLTALDSADRPSPRAGNAVASLLSLLGRPVECPADRDSRGSLAPDLWDLVGRGQPHWAGNINVFIGAHAVERHLSRALRVYPGRTNLAMFVVGGPGKRDGYTFELVGLGPEWRAALYDMTNRKTLVSDPAKVPIAETQWVESEGGLLVMLATQPPAGCRAGNLEVQVTSRSRRKTAVVEFSLDPAAQGAGCYCV